MPQATAEMRAFRGDSLNVHFERYPQSNTKSHAKAVART